MLYPSFVCICKLYQTRNFLILTPNFDIILGISWQCYVNKLNGNSLNQVVQEIGSFKVCNVNFILPRSKIHCNVGCFLSITQKLVGGMSCDLRYAHLKHLESNFCSLKKKIGI